MFGCHFPSSISFQPFKRRILHLINWNFLRTTVTCKGKTTLGKKKKKKTPPATEQCGKCMYSGGKMCIYYFARGAHIMSPSFLPVQLKQIGDLLLVYISPQLILFPIVCLTTLLSRRRGGANGAACRFYIAQQSTPHFHSHPILNCFCLVNINKKHLV